MAKPVGQTYNGRLIGHHGLEKLRQEGARLAGARLMDGGVAKLVLGADGGFLVLGVIQKKLRVQGCGGGGVVGVAGVAGLQGCRGCRGCRVRSMQVRVES